MRRLCLLAVACSSLLSGAAGAEPQNSRMEAFVKLCTAVAEKAADIEAVAASMGLKPPGTTPVVTLANMTSTIYTSDGGQLSFTITKTVYHDAIETECGSAGQKGFTADDLDMLQRFLTSGDYDGDAVRQPWGIINGRWKRKGNNPLIFVTVSSFGSVSVVMMRTIEHVGVPLDRKPNQK